MSDTKREARGARFDEAVDRAVREMLDVEPPPGLRGRVLDRIDRTPTGGWSWTWLAAPAVTAALIVLAVLAPWRAPGPVLAPPATHVATDQHLPGPVEPSPPSQRLPQTMVAKVRPPAPRVDRRVQAAVTEANEEFAASQIQALAGPAPLAIEQLTGPAAPAVRTVDVIPIQVRALEVSALTETPRERREE